MRKVSTKCAGTSPRNCESAQIRIEELGGGWTITLAFRELNDYLTYVSETVGLRHKFTEYVHHTFLPRLTPRYAPAPAHARCPLTTTQPRSKHPQSSILPIDEIRGPT